MPTTPSRSWKRASVPVVLALALGLSACDPVPSPQPTPSVSSPQSPYASPSPSEESPSPSASPVEQLSADDIANIQESISSGNTAALEGYLANPIHVAFAASEFSEDRTPIEAIGDLDYLSGATGWNWSVDASTLATWRASAFYGTWFPDGAIIGHADSGQVISFVVAGRTVTAIYIAGSDDSLEG